VTEEQEHLLLTQKQRDWLKVLHEVKQGHLTQAGAAGHLGISERWVRELVRRVRRRGDRTVVHGLQGKVSPRRMSGKARARALRIYRKEYGDFGPTLAAEYLAEQHGITVSKETLRKWLMEAGEWQAKPRRIQQVHVWRPRRSCCGELVQWDTSIHDWLEGRSLGNLALAETAGAAEDQRWKKALTQSNSLSKRPAFLWAHGLSRMPTFFYRSGPASPPLVLRCSSGVSV
jgi:transposase